MLTNGNNRKDEMPSETWVNSRIGRQWANYIGATSQAAPASFPTLDF